MPPMPPGMPPMPPQGAPPQGAPPMGAGIAQVLQQLMQNPAALQGMQNFMQGQPPMPMPQGGPPPMPPQGGPPPGPPMPAGGGDEAPPDDAEAMAADQIDKAGQTWDGVDAPTKNDIERLQEDPSDSNIKSFDEQFGDGMAEKYLGQDEEDKGDQGADEGSEGSKSEPTYDE